MQGVRERRERSEMEKARSEFSHALDEDDFCAAYRLVESYSRKPSVTEMQVRMLSQRKTFGTLKHFESPYWHLTMAALRISDFGKSEGWKLSGLIMGNDTAMHLLNAEYAVICGECKRKRGIPLSVEELSDMASAHKLLGYRRQELDALYLSDLVLEGREPCDLVKIRYGLAEWYDDLERLEQRKNAELSAGEGSKARETENRMAWTMKSILSVAQRCCEQKRDKLPDYYFRHLRKEKEMLSGLAANGWDGRMEISPFMRLKYGLEASFSHMSELRLKEAVSSSKGDKTSYRHRLYEGNRRIKEASGKALAELEKQLHPYGPEHPGEGRAAIISEKLGTYERPRIVKQPSNQIRL